MGEGLDVAVMAGGEVRLPSRMLVKGKRGEADEACHRCYWTQHIDELDCCGLRIERLALHVDVIGDLRSRAIISGSIASRENNLSRPVLGAMPLPLRPPDPRPHAAAVLDHGPELAQAALRDAVAGLDAGERQGSAGEKAIEFLMQCKARLFRQRGSAARNSARKASRRRSIGSGSKMSRNRHLR